MAGPGLRRKALPVLNLFRLSSYRFFRNLLNWVHKQQLSDLATVDFPALPGPSLPSPTR